MLESRTQFLFFVLAWSKAPQRALQPILLIKKRNPLPHATKKWVFTRKIWQPSYPSAINHGFGPLALPCFAQSLTAELRRVLRSCAVKDTAKKNVPRLLEVCLFSSSQSKFYLPKKQLKQLLRKVPHEFTHCK